MRDFNPDLLLPPELTIVSVDEHLYRIGLCLTPNRHNTRRSLIFHPILITIVCIIFLIQRIASIFTEQRSILLLLCDIGHLFGMRIYANLGLISASLFMLFSQLIYYYNNNLYIRPTFLTLFHMMSGSVSPLSIGLNDKYQVNKVLSLSRKLFIIVKYECQYIITMCSFILNISIYIAFMPFNEILLYGIPNTITVCFESIYFWNFLGYQYVYYYLVCKYLDMKLKNTNEKLVLLRKEEQQCEIIKILKTLNAIYCEIKEYDSTYLSKFLLNVWLLIGTILVILIYVDIFITFQLLMRIIIHYITMLYFFLFIFTITTAASINYDNRKSYKLLNSLFMVFPPRLNHSHNGEISTKYKVRHC